MDGDEFTHRYQLLKKLVDGEVVTYLARASSGDRVMTHFLQGDRPDELLAGVDALSDARRRRVRTVTDLDGTPVVVTDYLDDFESFAAWVGAGGPAPGADVPAPPEPPAGAGPERDPAQVEEDTTSDEPGEFTRMFEAPDDGGTSEREADAPPASSSEPSKEPGEFTRMFEAPGSDAGPAASGPGTEAPEGSEGDAGSAEAPDREPSPPAEAASPGSGTGERPFLFRSPVEEEATEGDVEEDAGEAEKDEPRDGPDEDPGTAEPGELTRMFEAPSDDAPETRDREPRGGDREPCEPEPREMEPREPPSGEPGEFTRRFGTADAGGEGETGAEPVGDDGDAGEDRGSATDAFRRPEPGASEETSGDRPGEDARSRPGGADRGPGEFTRMFGSRGDPGGSSPGRSGSGPGAGLGGSAGEDPDDYLRRLGAEPSPPSAEAGAGAAPEAGADGPTGGPGSPGGGPGPEVGGGGEDGDVSRRGPSDYTRVVRGRTPQGAGASPEAAPPPAPSPSERETRHWPYLVALGGILLVAIVLLVVFLLTGSGGDDAAPDGDAGQGEATTEEVVSPPGEGG